MGVSVRQLRNTLRKIAGFENYTVSEDGIVTNTIKGTTLKHTLNENGYIYVNLSKSGKVTAKLLHRLVAGAYIPNPEFKPFVNHIDANRSNPRLYNLEWCTQSENIKHAYRLGNMSQKRNFDANELDWLLEEFLLNHSMTLLAKRMGVGLSRLTINLRNHAIRTRRDKDFEAMLVQQKRARNTEANAPRRRPVAQIDPATGTIVATFPSPTAAARSLGKLTSGPIANALNPGNSQKIGYGFQWKLI